MRHSGWVISVALLIGLVACSGAQGGTAEPSGSGSAGPHGSLDTGATTPAGPSATPGVPVEWTEVASFATDGGLAAAYDVTASASGYVAVGVALSHQDPEQGRSAGG